MNAETYSQVRDGFRLLCCIAAIGCQCEMRMMRTCECTKTEFEMQPSSSTARVILLLIVPCSYPLVYVDSPWLNVLYYKHADICLKRMANDRPIGCKRRRFKSQGVLVLTPSAGNNWNSCAELKATKRWIGYWSGYYLYLYLLLVGGYGSSCCLTTTLYSLDDKKVKTLTSNKTQKGIRFRCFKATYFRICSLVLLGAQTLSAVLSLQITRK